MASLENPESEPRAHALVDAIAASIRARIIAGDIPIGAQLRQAELAKDFGVSRTPVREALRQLQSGSLVEVVPNRGAVVRVPAPWEVREAYQVRAELESLAAGLAIEYVSDADLQRLRDANHAMYEQRASRGGDGNPTQAAVSANRTENDLFHKSIAELSGNSRLAKAIEDINESFPRNVSAQLLVNDDRRSKENFDEHERILNAIESGSVEVARDEMRKHVLAAGELVARWYERRSSSVFSG